MASREQLGNKAGTRTMRFPVVAAVLLFSVCFVSSMSAQQSALEQGTRPVSVKTLYLEMKYYATKDVVQPGSRITLVADFVLPPKMHVYSPEVKGYIPIKLELDPSVNFTAQPAEYPPGELILLPAIKEIVPVYQERFRITQEVTMGSASALQPLISSQKPLAIRGKLSYQACDDKMCYLPQTMPLTWTLKVESSAREPLTQPKPPKAPH